MTENEVTDPQLETNRRGGFLTPPSSLIWALVCVLVAALVYVLHDLVLILLLAATLAYLINPV
ncbi:MAG TPA: hypothetical protein VLX11_16915, partial [Candidatus Acidoferrales bacterium]|nr:hypothetical protein [Candidatus Acidoferrales bacterium]